MAFDFSLFLKDNFRPGVNWIIEGPRGSGKTHAGIVLLHDLVSGKYPECGHVEVITNIVFGTRSKGGEIIMGHPPGVHYVNTFADALRKTGEILKEKGIGKVTIAFVLDEAQNFMIADLNAAAENQALIKFMGNTRKFGMCTMFLTPTRRNLAPKIRNFDDDLAAPGYCGVIMRKDVAKAESISRSSRGRIPARELTFLSLSSAMEDLPVRFGMAPWTMPLENLRPGEYVYDTFSAADFSLGENMKGDRFDIKDFLRFVSKGISTAIPGAICEYFERWDSCDQLEEEDEGTLQAHRIERARTIGITWENIAFIENEPRKTLTYRHKKVFGENRGSGAGAYIKPNRKGAKGDFSPPRFDGQGGRVCEA